MTRDEVKKLLAVMLTLYPSFKPDNMTALTDAWAAVMADVPYKVAEAGLFAYIRNDIKGFAPSVGQILAAYQENANPKLSEAEAWSLCRKAIGKGIYESRTAFEELPKEIQRAVGSPSQLYDWAMTDMSELPVIQSNFMRTYRAVCIQESHAETMPERLKLMVKETAERLTQKEVLTDVD